MAHTTQWTDRDGFFIPGQIGLIIEATILLVFLGLFIFGGSLAGDAVSQFLQGAAEENLKAFRDEVEYGCTAGERTGESVSEDWDFKESIVEVRTVDGGATYEATLDDGSTITVENDGCDAVHICSGPVSVDCTEGTLSGGFVEMDLLFQDTGGGSDPDVLWIAQTNTEGAGGTCTGEPDPDRATGDTYGCAAFSDSRSQCEQVAQSSPCTWGTAPGDTSGQEYCYAEGGGDGGSELCSAINDIGNPEEACADAGCRWEESTVIEEEEAVPCIGSCVSASRVIDDPSLCETTYSTEACGDTGTTICCVQEDDTCGPDGSCVSPTGTTQSCDQLVGVDDDTVCGGSGACCLNAE